MKKDISIVQPGGYILWPNGKISEVKQVVKSSIYVPSRTDVDKLRKYWPYELAHAGAKWVPKSVGDDIYPYLIKKSYRGARFENFATVEGVLFSDMPKQGLVVDEAGHAYVLDHALQPRHIARVFGVSLRVVEDYLSRYPEPEMYKPSRLTNSERYYIRMHEGRKDDDIIVGKIGKEKEKATRTYLCSLRGERHVEVVETV